MYIHCLDGVDVTSTLIACLRKIQGWKEPAIHDELARGVYASTSKSAGPKESAPKHLLQFVERFGQPDGVLLPSEIGFLAGSGRVLVCISCRTILGIADQRQCVILRLTSTLSVAKATLHRSKRASVPCGLSLTITAHEHPVCSLYPTVLKELRPTYHWAA